jgi:uncharacterized phage-associated protein
VRFVFNETKAAQAAAYVLGLAGGQLEYIVLMKLLYLADRRSLIETGCPITGDRMVSMDYGPVLSRTLNLINLGDCGERGPRAAWYRYISEPEGYVVKLIAPGAPLDELSAYERDILGELYQQFGNMGKWDLVEYTHRLPEWRDPQGSSLQIDPIEILRAEGQGEETIAEAVSQAKDALFFSKLGT